MKNLGTAIESFRLDQGVMLVDFWDEGSLIERVQNMGIVFA